MSGRQQQQQMLTLAQAKQVADKLKDNPRQQSMKVDGMDKRAQVGRFEHSDSAKFKLVEKHSNKPVAPLGDKGNNALKPKLRNLVKNAKAKKGGSGSVPIEQAMGVVENDWYIWGDRDRIQGILDELEASYDKKKSAAAAKKEKVVVDAEEPVTQAAFNQLLHLNVGTAQNVAGNTKNIQALTVEQKKQQAELSEVRSELSETKSELSNTKSELSNTKSELSNVQSEQKQMKVSFQALSDSVKKEQKAREKAEGLKARNLIDEFPLVNAITPYRSNKKMSARRPPRSAKKPPASIPAPSPSPLSGKRKAKGNVPSPASTAKPNMPSPSFTAVSGQRKAKGKVPSPAFTAKRNIPSPSSAAKRLRTTPAAARTTPASARASAKSDLEAIVFNSRSSIDKKMSAGGKLDEGDLNDFEALPVFEGEVVGNYEYEQVYVKALLHFMNSDGEYKIKAILVTKEASSANENNSKNVKLTITSRTGRIVDAEKGSVWFAPGTKFKILNHTSKKAKVSGGMKHQFVFVETKESEYLSNA